MEKKKNFVEIGLGFALLVGVIVLGQAKLASPMLLFRLCIGMGLGYVFSRAYTGFAGSVNRAYNAGSTKLMRAMAIMFLVTAIGVAGLLMFNIDPETGEAIVAFGLSIKPINLGLLLGGLMFGFGMALASCCASGIMSDLASETPKAIITMFFFGLGVLIGMPFDNKKWVTESLIKLGDRNGVFFPDLFKGSSVNMYLGGVLVTAVIVIAVVALSYKYESYRKSKGTLGVVLSEQRVEAQKQVELPTDSKGLGSYIYDRLFVDAWSVFTGAFLIAILFLTMYGATKGGWGASGPFGNWSAKVLMMVGVSPEALATYTSKAPEFFTASIFTNGIGIQNMGIAVGAFVYLLTSSQLLKTAQNFFNVPKLQWALYILGGLTMGIGTRMSQGCNAGALYTPAAQMSLSGWVFLIALIGGGILGNSFQKKIFNKKSA